MKAPENKKQGKLKSLVGRSSIAQKLSFVFAVLIILPSVVISLKSYELSKQVIEAKMQNYRYDFLNQTIENIQNRVDQEENITFNAICDTALQQLLITSNRGFQNDFDKLKIKKKIEGILSSYVMFHDEVMSVQLVSSSGIVYENNKNFERYDAKTADCRKIYNANGDVIWYPTDTKTDLVTVARSLSNLVTQKPIGYMVLHIKASYFGELFSQSDAQLFDEGSVFLADGDRLVITENDGSGTAAQLTDACFAKAFGTGQFQFYTDVYQKEPSYISCSKSLNNGWKLISVVSVRYYMRKLIELRNSIILISIFTACLTIILCLSITKAIIRPIHKLSRTMARFGNGDFTAKSDIISNDEVGKLSQSFNQMADSINTLVSTVYEQKILNQQAEMKAMQMQINPHFLYNTLETINWMARIKKVDEIGDVAKHLGDLMRSTIEDEDLVPIAKEVKNLKDYIYIQKFRYGDKFEATIDIGPALDFLAIPKLVIQPILENAIVHGIEPMIGKGRVKVTGTLKDGIVWIVVQDNGVGMTEETVLKILSDSFELKNEGHTLIGIRNVEKRIRLCYGDDYGLLLQSSPGNGTKVTIRFPATAWHCTKKTEAKPT